MCRSTSNVLQSSTLFGAEVIHSASGFSPKKLAVLVLLVLFLIHGGPLCGMEKSHLLLVCCITAFQYLCLYSRIHKLSFIQREQTNYSSSSSLEDLERALLRVGEELCFHYLQPQ